ncbi:hypothetical protein C7C46_13535 [Streptomyces tateyamensis]|uniref:Uncharacterized protein n=1 Tax=Streptomyces tateyamensis TaxID=565073 RepID=A0A2V4N6M4_9ACTN|nr:hypothetical protein C7C46_13535 [Streptomyces tateyamensis]
MDERACPMRNAGRHERGSDRGGALRVHEYPLWLRVRLCIPLIDRFAYPHAARTNTTLGPDRSGVASAFSYDPATGKQRVLYHRRRMDAPRHYD